MIVQPATTTTVFHPHELQMQRLTMKAADVEHMAEVGKRFIRNSMPQQHMDFFAGQQVVLSCVTDAQGRPVAQALVGPLGFVACPSPTEITINPAHTLAPGTPFPLSQLHSRMPDHPHSHNPPLLLQICSGRAAPSACWASSCTRGGATA